MEDDDTSNSRNQFNSDGDQKRIVQQLLRTNISDGDQNRIVQRLPRTNISRNRKQLFWYDIQNLPDLLLIEILARLPVKSIHRFISVCKHWKTLISHPSFCVFYHSILASSLSRPFHLLLRHPGVRNFEGFINRLGIIRSSSRFSVLFLSNSKKRLRYDQFRVLAINNGLILLCLRSMTPFVYCICDPLTRQCITIRRRGPKVHRFFGEGFTTKITEDHMLFSYTVVKANPPASPSNSLNLEMFSSETCKWISYELPCAVPIELHEQGRPILCYGAFHWPVKYHGMLGSDQCMVAFDPHKDPKSVRLIPFPEDRDLESEKIDLGACRLCGESQGILCYFEVARDSTKLYLFKMWAMKDYEKGEWCCEFMVRRSDVHSSDLKLSNWLVDGGCFLPLSFHPLNQNVVYLSCMDPKCIVRYDVQNRRLDVACKQIGVHECVSWPTVIPFVSPSWPVLG